MVDPVEEKPRDRPAIHIGGKILNENVFEVLSS
jgi:hypothetical protein